METNKQYVHGQVFPDHGKTGDEASRQGPPKDFTDFQSAVLYNEVLKEVPKRELDYWLEIAKEGVVKPAVGLKFDDGKPRMDLIDPEFLEDMGAVLGYGAKKYAQHNWRNGLHVSRTIAAIYRHLGAINRGEDRDPESGHLHSAHLGVNVQFLNWMIKNKPEMDDRWKP